MPAPRVFVSSTYYDLAPIRADIERMIRDLGYVPILSESGSATYDPREHVANAVVQEAANCDMLVLVIGGRRGSSMPDQETSVTNAEYESALRNGVPIFALVQEDVLSDLRTYEMNISNSEVDQEKIQYGSVDSTSVFRFVNQVRNSLVNNSLQPFRAFADIERYLKGQWAGLLQAYMRQQTAERQVADTLAELRGMSQKIEALSELIFKAVEPSEAGDLDDRLARIEQSRSIAEYLVMRGVLDLTQVRKFESPIELADHFSLDVDSPLRRAAATEGFLADYAELRRLPDADLDFLQRMVGRGSRFVLNERRRAYEGRLAPGDPVLVRTPNGSQTGTIVGSMMSGSNYIVRLDDGDEVRVPTSRLFRLSGPVSPS